MKKHSAETVYLVFNVATSALFTLVFVVNMLYFVTVALLDPLQLVLVGTALELSIFIFEIPTGILADLKSRRLSVIIGVFLLGAGFLVEGIWPVFIPILLGQVLWGLGYTFTSGALQAWISDEVGEANSGRMFVRGAKFSQIGSLIATGFSVLLAQIAVNVPIIISASLFAILALYLILFMPETKFKPTPAEDRNTYQQMIHTFRSGVGMVRIRPALAGILLIGLFFGLYSEGYDRLWTAHLLDKFTLPSVAGLNEALWFGLLNAVSVLLSLIATHTVEKKANLARPQELVRLLSGLSLLLVFSLVGFSLVSNLSVAIGLILAISVIREVINPLYVAWVNHRLDSRVRATVLSMSSQVDAVGQVAGGPVLGVVARNISIQAGLLGSAILLSPVLALLGWQLKNGSEETGMAVEEAQ